MIKKIIKFIVCALICLCVLRFGGYTFQSFSRAIDLKNPLDTLKPITSYLPNLPEVTTEDSTTEEIFNITNKNSTTESTTESNSITITTEQKVTEDSTNNSTETTEISKNLFKDTTTESNKLSKIKISATRSIKVSINDQEYELTSTNTISFIKWLGQNYNKNSKIDIKDENKTTIDKITYTKELKNKDDLDKLISTIKVAENNTDREYNRDNFEKPVQKYEIDDKSYNRNDYAWKTSKYLKDEKKFKYICPYTGKTVTDEDDLDYDHIVSLKTVEQTCPDWWTNEDRNKYAYDQAVGVDVYYSANRSKGSKTPSQWLPDTNIADYCYTYLMICSKYELTMSQKDIDICYSEITKALDNKETISTLNNLIYKNKIEEDK